MHLEMKNDVTIYEKTEEEITNMNKQILINPSTSITCCLAADTLILMGDGSHKRIEEIKTGDYILSINEEPQEVGCDTENEVETYFILKTEKERELIITGDHPVFTTKGWQQVKKLVTGDQLRYAYSTETAEEFEEIISIQVKNEKRKMYNLICDDMPLIANGFICSDFHMQYKMELMEKYKKS